MTCLANSRLLKFLKFFAIITTIITPTVLPPISWEWTLNNIGTKSKGQSMFWWPLPKLLRTTALVSLLLLCSQFIAPALTLNPAENSMRSHLHKSLYLNQRIKPEHCEQRALLGTTSLPEKLQNHFWQSNLKCMLHWQHSSDIIRPWGHISIPITVTNSCSMTETSLLC